MENQPVPWNLKDVLLTFIYTAALCLVIIFWSMLIVGLTMVIWQHATGETGGSVREALRDVHDAYFILVFYAALYLAFRHRIVRRYNLDLRRVFFASSAPLKDVWAGIKAYLAFAVGLVSLVILVFLAAALLDAFFGTRSTEGVEVYFIASHLEQMEVKPVAQHAVGVILILVLGPFFEEVLFRGCLYRALRRRFAFWPAALLGSLGFAAVHGYLFLFLYVFVLGLVLTILYERRGNLVAPLTFHILNNGVVVVLFFLSIKG